MDRIAAPLPATASLPVHISQQTITAALVIGPFVAVAAAVPLLWGSVIHVRDVVLAVVLYAVTGHGVTVGFHRMFTHRSFKATRPLKIVLAVAGSMAVEGSLVSWVANHRRHHMFSDREGDPHSPHGHGSGLRGQLRGFAHAHIGWLFKTDNSPPERFAPDMLRDRDVLIISRLFPLLALASFAIPFLAGWGLSGKVAGGLTALLWAGLVRMAVLHHVTWSVNSICHMFGRRPHEADDRSTNFAPLAIISMGESWHNLHHAYPSSARHGAERGQLDSSAALIRIFEKAGWATKVRWPRERLASSLRGDSNEQ
jgi:stearoyl-CoA desaturase (delta-9 desaturase)